MQWKAAMNGKQYFLCSYFWIDSWSSVILYVSILLLEFHNNSSSIEKDRQTLLLYGSMVVLGFILQTWRPILIWDVVGLM